MAILPEEFIPVAERLDTPQLNSPNEADLRTSFGRSYYSAYLFARDTLSAAGFKAPPGAIGVHEWLLHKLTTAKDPEIQDLGQRLRRLYKKRIDSDYVLASGHYRAGDGAITAQTARLWIDEFKAYIPKLGTAIRPG